MKKSVRISLCFFFLFQAATALAATPAVTAGTLPSFSVRQLTGIERWLNRNELGGIAYIEDNYSSARLLAQKWDMQSELYLIDVSVPGISNCKFEFGSPNVPNKLFVVNCTDPVAGKQTGAIVASQVKSDELFWRSNMSLMKFLSEILGSSGVLGKMNSYFGNVHLDALDFQLSAPNGVMQWSAELMAENKTLDMTVKAVTTEPLQFDVTQK